MSPPDESQVHPLPVLLVSCKYFYVVLSVHTDGCRRLCRTCVPRHGPESGGSVVSTDGRDGGAVGDSLRLCVETDRSNRSSCPVRSDP